MTTRTTLLMLLLAAGCCSCATAIHIGGPAADLASTQWAKQQGAVEANPLIGQSTVKLVMVKAGQAGLLLWVDHQLKPHPKAQKVLRVLAGLANFGVAAHNVQVGMQARKEKRK